MGNATRIRKLKTLFDVKFGPGAAVLPPQVKRIHLDFALKINDGHMGARKLWRNYLPRLKYHNPAVSITVNRTTDQAGPATLTIFIKGKVDGLADAASTVDIEERTESIDMKHKRDSEILSQLLERTKAEEVVATGEEESQIWRLMQEAADAQKDSERDIRRMEERRKEANLLK